MEDEKAIVKYEYLHRLDAVCDLFLGVLATGATTTEELAAYLPAIMQSIPEYHASLVPKAQPDLIVALLKPKNRGAVAAFAPALKRYLNDLAAKIDEGQPIVSSFPFFSPEVYFGMGLVPCISEALGLLIAAALTEGVEAELNEAELDGIPGHVCGFQKAPIKAFEKALLPKPDLFVSNTAPCDSSNIMYQYMAHRLKVPLVTVDSPYYNNTRSFAYFCDEFKRMVEKVQKATGHTLDEEVLRKHVVMGNEQLRHLYGLQGLRRLIPCPDPGMHRGLDTLALTLCGANQGFADYMRVCYEESSERVSQGRSFLPEGRKEVRTLWTYSMVPNMLYLPSWLEDEFGSTYLECSLSNMPAETVGYVDTSTVDSMLEGLAWRSFNFVMHRNVMGHTDIHVNDMLTVARAYHAEAAVFAGNSSCKYAWTLPKMMGDVLRDELGIPSVTFEMDMIDARFAPHASIKALLTEFFQTLT